MESAFAYDDYKAFLLAVEVHWSGIQRGFRSRLAEALGCQNAYISQVLNHNAQFSLEQGLKICGLLSLPAEERKYFLTLIEHARAGTTELKAHFAEELSTLRAKQLNLKERVGSAFILSAEAQTIYYSHWIYAAIHMFTTLPQQGGVREIALALRLPEDSVRSAVMFLISVGLVQENDGRLSAGSSQVHLGKDSHQIRQHHTNWRLAAIDSFVRIEKNNIHYSTVSTLSHADVERLKARFVKEIESYTKTVRASREETIYGFNLDFYSLLRT